MDYKNTLDYFKDRIKQSIRDNPNKYKKGKVVERSLTQSELLLRSNNPGRNALCICGSGLKFKKCCGKDI